MNQIDISPRDLCKIPLLYKQNQTYISYYIISNNVSNNTIQSNKDETCYLNLGFNYVLYCFIGSFAF